MSFWINSPATTPDNANEELQPSAHEWDERLKAHTERIAAEMGALGGLD